MDSARATTVPNPRWQVTLKPRRTVRARASFLDRWLAARLQRTIAPAGVRLQLWDGSSLAEAPERPIGELVIHDRATLLGLAVHPDLWFGESYMTGRLDVRGPLQAVVESLTRLRPPEATWKHRIAVRFTRTNTLRESRRNVHHHYDLGNAFYEHWLDRQLVYTCAYFPDEAMTLDDAQTAKLDLICRKLRLQPGEQVVEAGCGWGALALHMARHYGVRVRAFNLSREQIAYARERARREGLDGAVEFVHDDYRSVSGRFDVFVSVGMLEHVGLKQFGALANVLARSVRRNGGRGLLHFIGRDAPHPLNAWIRRRIFPGAYPPTLAEVTERVLVPAGMTVVDVENLRLHYARTLAHWSRRFASARNAVRDAYGETFCRAWELYLAGSEAAFLTGWLQLFQVLFTPTGSAPPFWTRRELYADSGGLR